MNGRAYMVAMGFWALVTGGSCSSGGTRHADVLDHDGDGIGRDTEYQPPDFGRTTDVDSDDSPSSGEVVQGGPGWLCEQPDDCLSRLCVASARGHVCTQTCVSACPDGWSCRQNVAVLPSILFVCLPSFPSLCFPCDDNTDCVTENDNTPHRCVAHGDEGSFCGGSCADVDCPVGYFCSRMADVDGVVSPQCVPEAGACTCPAGAVAKEATTVCAMRNEWGVCQGRRGCADGVLSACDAATPAEDRCDGQDNDCNGLTDDDFVAQPCTNENEFGTCNGQTDCQGSSGVQCTAPAAAVETCDGSDNDCDGLTDESDAQGCQTYYPDADNDSFGRDEAQCLCAPTGDLRATRAGDCDDAHAMVRPDADEICNGRDDNCDSQVDEPGAAGCSAFFPDADTDGFGDAGDSRCLCLPATPYVTTDDRDCADDDAAISPAASETCDGGDNDCDGLTDEDGAAGCTLYFADADLDGFGDPTRFACRCAPGAPFVATVGGDCNDAAMAIHPGLSEACDGADNDCNGLTDEGGALGCQVYYLDADADSYGVAGDYRCLCQPLDAYAAEQAGDCNDGAAAAHPGAGEVCNGIDDDCDHAVDEHDAGGCTGYYEDHDLDGYGTPGDSACLCTPAIPFVALNADDCDDSNPFIHPDTTEQCNGLDDDCDGVTDLGVEGTCSAFYRDGDSDGWGSAESACLCSPEGEFTTTKTGDCDDEDATIYPLAQEFCNDHDDDCDGQTDEDDALGCLLYLRDEDGDGFGRLDDTRCLCATDPQGLYSSQTPDDCNDLDAEVRPGAAEHCNTHDDDCDGATDEAGAQGCQLFLRDTDGDGFGVLGDSACLCAATGFYRAAVSGDCDDTDEAVYPTGIETCNGFDDDCNGVVDDPGIEGCQDYYRDADGDQWGTAGESACLCGPSGSYTANQPGDCDDALGTRNPDATEQCNGSDDDCNGQTDEPDAQGCIEFMADADGDSFGVAGDTRCLCVPDSLYRGLIPGDCDDTRSAVSPAAAERCDDIDDDCDSQTDEPDAQGCTFFLRDSDDDGYGMSGDRRCLCLAQTPYDAAVGGDCDDANDAVFPGQDELCNGLDDDCDGVQDQVGSQGCTTYYKDSDGDDWGVAADSLCLCHALGAYSAVQTNDCDDHNPLRNPGTTETCNGVDDDCNGQTDGTGVSGCTTYYTDADGDHFGVAGTGLCLCAPAAPRTALVTGDCNDAAAAVHPEATENCDAVDNECDGIVDEGCGLPALGWPTYLHDARRTGHTMQYESPDTPVLRWQTTLPVSGWSVRNSPVILENGDIVVAARNKVFRLAASNGAYSAWTPYTLPADIFPWAGPTAREGGTILVPAGTTLVMLRPDLTVVWSTNLGATIVSTPMVDPNGNIYVVTAAALVRLGPDGVAQWSVAVANNATTPSHPAIGINGEIYFAAADHKIYSVDPEAPAAQRLRWAIVPTGVPSSELSQAVDSSVVVSELGNAYQAFGDSLYALNVFGQTIYTADLNLAIHSGLAIHNTGYQCCNPSEFLWVSPSGTQPVRGYGINLAYLAASASSVVKSADQRSATPVFDRNGDVIVGSDNATLWSFAQSGANKWSFSNSGGGGMGNVDGAAAVGNGIVVFGDANGKILCLQE